MSATPQLPHPDRDQIDLAAVLFALSDEPRLALVRELADGPLDMGECVALGAAPKSTKSHQAKVLREAGVVFSELVGRNRRLTLRRDDLDARFPGLLDAILGVGSKAPR